MLHQIAYVSLSREKLDALTLSDILSTSKSNNASEEITGVLMHHDRIYFQIIEGEKAHVKDLFSRIQEDDRHESIALVWDDNVEDRDFPKWLMGYAGPDEVGHHSGGALPDLAALLEMKKTNRTDDSTSLTLARNMFQSFLE